MTPEQDAKLCADFPEIFSQRNGSIMETCMAWGFECGSGWEKLIRTACEQLTYLSKVSGAKFTASQIKEKFGTLRFYIHTEIADTLTEADRQIVWDLSSLIEQSAETRSGQTCEKCGEPGRTRGHGWYATLCAEHAYKSNYPLNVYEMELLQRDLPTFVKEDAVEETQEP